MRTRRSPRNQERLWRALGGPQPPTPRRSTPLLSRAAASAIMWDVRPDDATLAAMSSRDRERVIRHFATQSR